MNTYTVTNIDQVWLIDAGATNLTTGTAGRPATYYGDYSKEAYTLDSVMLGFFVSLLVLCALVGLWITRPRRK